VTPNLVLPGSSHLSAGILLFQRTEWEYAPAWREMVSGVALTDRQWFEKVNKPSDNRQSPLARNRMLIRNGSSFNAVVRALKQDLLENASPEDQDTNLIYEVDKVSSNRF
jgi:hypothetical protein